ncbi:MAG: acyltransferase domain-containing protein [Prolixibacteraceae bacterium]|nr:acyltransferase domain-containing protein [Prolixibacteraceae bacterium]
MESNTDGIAVIGMAGRFPGAKNIDEFWANLLEGKETITYFTDEELAEKNMEFGKFKDDPNYIKARGIVDDIDKFDADFFGYTPMDARTMDPQHRVWLETAWNALENAGCDPNRYKGSIGVFAGSLYNTYLLNHVIRDQEALEKYLHLYEADSFQVMINNDSSFLATKTAYKLNLKGPAINVQSACSTSLVAIAQACQSLFSFESDTCIAGGVSLFLPQESGYTYQKGAINSPDGHCRPFDINSNGTIASNGVGAVVLKRLDDALADNDNIYAIIKGWGINNDGNKKVSYMAPSVDGQAEVIMLAQDIADVHPEDISYIETHGTATPLGDPIEIAALSKAFNSKTDKKQFCAIGSVKSNIGHLDTAAGVTGFIKTCLAAYHRKIPSTINFTSPNPNIDFAKSPFYVLNENMTWNSEKPLIMGVSSFGIGGTNTHVIVQEPERKSDSIKQTVKPQLVVLSAKSEAALNRKKKELAEFCEANTNTDLQAIAFTLQTGRSKMPFRSFGVFEKTEDLSTVSMDENFMDSFGVNESRSLAFMFPGQGAQYVNMGKNLYENEPVCRAIFDECFFIFRTETGINLKDILFTDQPGDELDKILAQTKYTQPTLFIVEYVVAKYLESFNIKPDVLIGHSIGEYAAACLSGVFSMADALRIVIKRGELMQKMPSGHMMVVKSNEVTLNSIKNNLFELAAINAPGYCTISFKPENKELVEKTLATNNIDSIPLNTSHAFHSAAFDPILAEFAEFVDRFELQTPKLPFISCLTGSYANRELVGKGKYWADQLRNTVLFEKGIRTISESGDFIYLEVGPNTHLNSLAKRSIGAGAKSPVLFTLGKPENENEQVKMMISVGQLWAKGIDPDFEMLHHPENPQKIVLPSYPFEQKKHWIEKVEFKGSNIQTEQIQSKVQNGQENSDSLADESTTSGNQDTLSILKQMLCDLSGIEPIEVKNTISFTYLGLESLFLAQYAQAIEKRFQITIKFRQLIQEYPNLEQLSGYVDERMPSKEKSSRTTTTVGKLKSGGNMVILKPHGKNLPFTMIFGDICNTYLPRRVREEHPYWGFMHSGSDGEKIEFRSIEEMAKSYVDELVAYRPEGPYLIGGYSFGGIVAFEMAVQMQKRGLDVPMLIMIDSLNPLKRKRRISIEGAEYILKTIYKKSIYLIANHKRESMPIDYRNAYIMGVYANLWNKYKPTRFEGKLTLFKSSENRSKFKYLGWDEHSQSVDLLELKGNHMQIIREKENIDLMVEHINEILDHVQKSYSNKQ